MEALLVLGVLAFLYSLGYLLFHFIRKIRNKDQILSKKLFYPFFIGGMILSIIGGSNSDTTNTTQVIVKENEQLAAKITSLNKSNSLLEKKYNEQLKDLTNQMEIVKKENEQLKIDNGSLKKEISVLREKTKKLKENNNNLKSKLQAEHSTGNVSSSSNIATKSSNNSSENTSTSVSAACDIKGSVNGIYHVPGSRYYNRTKNVVQWFCSTKEAEAAGYRAPR
ncbi:hypothetical protein ACQKP0_04800 [Heyndrickxia sp. NPDC080065]|uniref:sunset domain-containing protein n=1 Tax=Heyndrickxia sp. NPDC080065 TaxID=3390568 RepID=UPI003D06F40A